MRLKRIAGYVIGLVPVTIFALFFLCAIYRAIIAPWSELLAVATVAFIVACLIGMLSISMDLLDS